MRRRRGVKDSKDDCSATYVHPEKFTLAVLRAATGNFAAENKLGEGGFGQVFKVLLEKLCISVDKDRHIFSDALMAHKLATCVYMFAGQA